MSTSNFSYANLSNLSLIESLYEDYLKDPQSVDISWRSFFEGMDFAASVLKKLPSGVQGTDDIRIYSLIQAYRNFGHLLAHINPLDQEPPKDIPELSLERLGFKSNEMDKPFPTWGILKEQRAPLKAIIERLKNIYCKKIGSEFMGLCNVELQSWIQEQLESNEHTLGQEQKLSIFDQLNKAELFESYLHMKYVGQTRFSLEGCETLIPMLFTILDDGSKQGVDEVFLGMAHRGRLNVLVNILNKPLASVFGEFEGYYSPGQMESTGDVKYHMGLTGTFTALSGHKVAVTITPNPSHLESVNPVVEGQTRAKQEKRKNKEERKQVLPILIHGDAAMAGQGVVYETMQLCRLNGYTTLGTIHVAINNQVGFTTWAKDGRSTRYCTDIARTFGAPVFHVNVEDPEACFFAAKLAIEIRQRFNTDVFIDLNGYRRYGHNEGDEPNFTQPLEYKTIHAKKGIREQYRDRLVQEGVIDAQKAESMEEQFKQTLRSEFDAAKNLVKQPQPPVNTESAPKEDLLKPFPTAVPADTLIKITEQFCKIPEGFSLHPKVQKLFQDRKNMVSGDPSAFKIDWGMGEFLAYGSLLSQNVHVRLTGQDARRGTFSHRHAAWIDQNNAKRYFPLAHVSDAQGLFDVFNSPLSEFACMGFEFGYTLSYPEALVIWEAQYGDFVNGAQIIIDQYLTGCEQKWNVSSALTLMLPHAYEGQGPEHSSARLERFLQQCGQDNIQVANCTTPAQLFHLLRRQALRPSKKPLVLLTPKSLLRHSACVSSLNEFSSGSFQEILDDPANPQKPKAIFFCSGKVYYDLVAERDKRNYKQAAFIRIEQFYPFNVARLKEILQKYPGFQECIWIQEEHKNMGGWEYIRPIFDEVLEGRMQVRYIGRDRSAAASVGTSALHKKEYQQMMDEAFKQGL